MKQFLIFLIIISVIGCTSDPEGYAVRGEVNDVEDGNILYVSTLDENNQPSKIDSVAIEDGKFTLDLPEVDQPNLSFLTIDGLNGNVMYISENETIDFEIYRDSLPASKVEGGKENRVLYEYLNYLKDLNKTVTGLRRDMQQEMTSNTDTAIIAKYQKEEENLRESDLQYKRELVEENPDTFVSVLILTDMLNMGASSREVRELYDSLAEGVKNTTIATNLRENLEKVGVTEIGSKAPEFSGPTPEGEEVSLREAMGKVTLIDFWAAWCRPCRVENPNIVRVYEKYHDKGFNIVGVSLDREDQRDRWLQAIEEDNLTWTQISNLQFWEEPIAQLYGVQAIPAAFILDEDGVIVAKNLRGEDLENKVKEMLGE